MLTSLTDRVEDFVLNTEENRSIDFTATRYLMKLFRTVTSDCQAFVGIDSRGLAKLTVKFIANYNF